MTKPRFSAQSDLERYAPDLLQIDALYAAAGEICTRRGAPSASLLREFRDGYRAAGYCSAGGANAEAAPLR